MLPSGRGLNTTPPRQLAIVSVRPNRVAMPVVAIACDSAANRSSRTPPLTCSRSCTCTVSNR
jgi:hypothetical protein